MIIVCNGGNRTGSTLSYNIARVLCELTGIEHSCFGSTPEQTMNLLINPLQPVHVVKMHHWSPPDVQSIKTIHTVRDYREVAASYSMLQEADGNKCDWEKVMSLLHEQRELTKALKHKDNVLFLWYNSLMEALPIQIEMVADFINIKAKPSIIDRVVKQVDINYAKQRCKDMRGGACYVSQLRKNHIGKFNGQPRMWDTDNLPLWVEQRIDKEIGNAFTILEGEV